MTSGASASVTNRVGSVSGGAASGAGSPVPTLSSSGSAFDLGKRVHRRASISGIDVNWLGLKTEALFSLYVHTDDCVLQPNEGSLFSVISFLHPLC